MFLTITRVASLLFLFLLISGLLFADYFAYQSLDPQGAPTDACPSEMLPTTVVTSDKMTSGHVTWCDYPAVYIYVRRPGESESKGNLVFRYFAEQSDISPKIEWTGNNALHISVGNVSQVTKRLAELDGVGISYSIGKEHYSQELWEIERTKGKLAVVIVSLLIVCLAYIFKMIVRSMKGNADAARPSYS